MRLGVYERVSAVCRPLSFGVIPLVNRNLVRVKSRQPHSSNSATSRLDNGPVLCDGAAGNGVVSTIASGSREKLMIHGMTGQKFGSPTRRPARWLRCIRYSKLLISCRSQRIKTEDVDDVVSNGRSDDGEGSDGD